jgi:hypothetical protein
LVEDTVAFCTLVEFHFKGPEISISKDSACFWMETSYKEHIQNGPGNTWAMEIMA